MMVLRAYRVGKLALEVLKKGLGKEVKILNIFRESLNLEVDGELVTVTLKDSPSPATINVVPEPPPLPLKFPDLREVIKPASPVITLGSGGLELLLQGGLKVLINEGSVEIYENRYKYLIEGGPRNTVSCGDLLKVLKQHIFLGEVVGKVDRETNYRVCQALSELGVKSRELAAEEVVKYVGKYVGAGSGLTPSYDDFLLGFVTALASRGGLGTSAPTHAVNELIKRTTPVSYLTLRNALRGYVPGLLDEGLTNYLRGLRERLEYLSVDSLSVGHNSGYYQVLGLVTGLVYFNCSSNLLSQIRELICR